MVILNVRKQIICRYRYRYRYRYRHRTSLHGRRVVCGRRGRLKG